ncbi:cerevisin [Nematocida sp. AWRm77]|nr:cerevisin [Nematocida sp. AWRm77]
MKWAVFLLFALAQSKRYIVLFKDALGAEDVQAHSQWIQGKETGDVEVRSFSAPGINGYIATLSEETAEEMRSRPEVQSVEENQEYKAQIPGYSSAFSWGADKTPDLTLNGPAEPLAYIAGEFAVINGIEEALFRGMHNILKGRRHFRKKPIKRIYRKHRKERHVLLPSHHAASPAPSKTTHANSLLLSNKEMGAIFDKMHYPKTSEHLSIQNTDSWGLGRLSQREHVYSLDTYIYPVRAGEGVTVFVLDTGVEADHPELKGKVEAGINLIDRNLKANDDNGHGTHCAGIIAGKTRGVAKKARIVPVKILSALGSGTTETTVLGLVYVMKEHHKKLKTEAAPKSVVNMSLGGIKSLVLNTVANKAVQMGISIVAAGGNDASDACNFSPASIEDVITVGAIDREDNIAQFSNTGKCVNVYAPGVNIMSSFLNGTEKVLSGTSMATPHVAGLAALYLGEEYRTPAELKLLIQMDSFHSGIISIASSKILNLRLSS